jgi:hypothetical protein
MTDESPPVLKVRRLRPEAHLPTKAFASDVNRRNPFISRVYH